MRRTVTAMRVLGFVLGTAACSFASTAPLRFTTVDDKHGLSENSVTSIVEDRQGFLWVGTQNGLNRFDGLDFKVFDARGDDAGGLVEDYINVLRVDRTGRVWIGTFAGGLSRYDPARGMFENFLHDPADPRSLGHNDVSALHEDASGAIWVGTRGGGLHRVDPNTGALARVPLALEGVGSANIGAITGAPDGGVWVGVLGAGLVELDRERVPRRRLHAGPGVATRLPSDDVSALELDDDGTLWIGTRRDGLARLRADGTFRTWRSEPAGPTSLAHDAVNALHRDSAGTLWVATARGLDQFDPATESFRHHRHAPGNPLSLPYDDISSVHEDSSGTLWIGTGGRGLARHEDVSGQFELLVHDPGDPGSLAPSGVWSVREGRDGSLWVGTFGGGLHRRAPGASAFVRYASDPDDPRSLSDNDVRALLEDREGRWWIATRRGLNRLDPGARGFRRYFNDRDDPASLAHDFVRTLYEDGAGTIWIGTYGGGLDRWDPATDGFVHHRHRADDPATLSDDRIYSLLQTDPETLWIGTHGGGLNRLVLATGAARRYRHVAGDEGTLGSDRVLALQPAPGDTLWIGTAAGLDRFDPRTERFTHQARLGNDAVLGLATDADGVLWMSQTDGIVRFDAARDEVRQFDLEEQLVSNEFNGGSAFRGASGRIYFGGVEGLVAISPGAEPKRPASAVPVLTEFLAFNRPVRTRAFDPESPLDQPIGHAARIELPHSLRTFGFAFAALRTPDPARSRFQYRLDGFDARWLETGSRNRVATYTNVPPGSYVFRVRASDAEGRWMPGDAHVAVRVRPPPWRTNWAYVAYATLALALLVATVGVRARRERRKLEAQRRAMDELDARVRQRTAELQARTLELESTIEQLRLTQGELLEAEKMASLGRLVAGVAHEVNTPLGVGITAVTFLRERLAPVRTALRRLVPGEEAEILLTPLTEASTMAETNLARAAQLVKSFKQVAVDQSSSHIRAVDVRGYLEGTLQSLQPELRKHGHRVVLECDPALRMTSRPDALYQIIANLVLNSVLHAYPGGRQGTLTIAVAPEATMLRLRYEDDGVGMDASTAQRIFEPFFTTKRGAGGTGLGMHIVYNLVSQALAGRIACSTAPGRGVRFDIVFPRVHPQAAPAPQGVSTP